MYYTYILESEKDFSLYIDSTSNLKKRFSDHNKGFSKATKHKTPFKLIHYESFVEKLDALHREEYLKSGYGRKSIKKLLRNYFSKRRKSVTKL